eukprot:2416499-Amphidinium_carterae.1
MRNTCTASVDYELFTKVWFTQRERLSASVYLSQPTSLQTAVRGPAGMPASFTAQQLENNGKHWSSCLNAMPTEHSGHASACEQLQI